MSPVSRVRRTDKKGFSKPEVHGTAAQEAARRDYRRKRMLIRIGQVLMVAAVLLAVEHAAAHLGVFGGRQPPTMIDLVAGWPLAGVVFVVGAVFAGQRR